MIKTHHETMQPIRVFAHPRDYQPEERVHLSPILKALWNTRKIEERIKVYGARAEMFIEVAAPEEADIHVLMMTWNYYVRQGRLDEVEEAVRRAEAQCKPLVALCRGDSPADILYPGITLFEQGAYRSRKRPPNTRVCGYPAFIPDYVAMYGDGQLQLRKKAPEPTVGFCGYAGGRSLDFLGREIKNRLKWLAFRAGYLQWEPPVVEPTRLRARILDALEESPVVQTNFVRRPRYRAGHQEVGGDKDPFHPTRLAFVNNILNTDYTVCVRGGGNFSARFYETLSLGRIPVFVNTDCILPYEHIIDFRDYVVWVDESEIPFIDEKVAGFHNSMSDADFVDRQLACRQLWLDFLSHDGFYRQFHRHFC